VLLEDGAQQGEGEGASGIHARFMAQPAAP
jgi:hypothetical protein